VIITRHAAQRMTERNVVPALLLQVIDEGSTRYSDNTHLWAWLHAPNRDDNLVCAVLVLEAAVVVKTVMNHWEITP
jgi:hypothetical protein